MKRVLLLVALATACLLSTSCALANGLGSTLGRTLQSVSRLVTG